MTHCLYEPNELALIRGQLEMASSKRQTEIGKGSSALMEDSAEPHTRSTTVHHKRRVEIWHLKNRSRGQGALERLKRRPASSSHTNASRRKRRVGGAAMMPKSRINFR